MTKVRSPINIALILTGESAQTVCLMNQQLGTAGNQEIVLGRERNLPHITLGMKALTAAECAELQRSIQHIEFPDEVNLTAVTQIERGGAKLRHILVEPSRELLRSHDAVMDLLEKIEFESTDASNFPEEVSDSIVDYVNNFQNYARENFSPHITLGYGDYDFNFKPMRANVNVQLCLIGDHGVCHSVLENNF